MQHREIAVGETLARGVIKGLWTLEAIDRPSPGWHEVEQDRARSAVPRDTRNPNDTRSVPTQRYPDAGTYRKPRNLAREWIAANPQQWELMRDAGCASEVPSSPSKADAGRDAAGRALAAYEARLQAGSMVPALETDSPYSGGVIIPEVLTGPIGTRYPDTVANRQQGG